MKTLLVAINSRYNHTNLAIRSIASYVKKNLSPEAVATADIEIREYTINQLQGDILRAIYETFPDYILFSVYIWNAEMTFKIIGELKKILPSSKIGVGGPEVSYCAEKVLDENPNIDFVICGEGEKTVLELIKTKFSSESKVAGVVWRESAQLTERKSFTERMPFPTLDELPFAYTDSELSDCADTKIFYYESSRGCPFHCSYCLSSIDKSVRYRSLDLVFTDLKRFLDAKVHLVKFVDRTFNLDEKRTIAIWDFIRKNHNGKTMFHFEIEAHTLSKKMLDFIQDFPTGIVQFEIGVQSTNEKTLKEIGRQTDFQKIKDNVCRIPKTIHKHLDLIAGLPYENLESFGKSFDDVINLKPDALQLGFLKVLSGTKMANYAASKEEYQFLSTPPYEVLKTPWLSYSDILFLKDLEKVLDIFYNSGNFPKTIEFLFKLPTAPNSEREQKSTSKPNSMPKLTPTSFSFFEFFSDLTRYFRAQGIFEKEHRETEYFGFLWNFLRNDCTDNGEKACSNGENDGDTNCIDSASSDILRETLRFDFVSAQKTSSFPDWYEHHYDKNAHHSALKAHTDMHSTRECYAHSEYETFDFDMETFLPAERDFLGENTLPSGNSSLSENTSPSKNTSPRDSRKKVAYLFLYDSVKGKTKNRRWIKLDEPGLN